MKFEEFINPRQGNMHVEEYSLKFTMLSSYAQSLVCNARDHMNMFFSGVANHVKERCRMPYSTII